LVVLLVGVVIARGAVNKLLDSSYGRWSFRQTWVLFYTQSLIPVVLFWFLDYTNVIHDTSLFAALAVAVGYQQIFAGGIKDITLPGQTSRLWQPFEAWRNSVINIIAIRARQRLDKFDQRVAAYCAEDAAKVAALSKAAVQYASDPVDLAAKTAAADVSTPEKTLSLVRLLIRELRSVDLARYGGILNRAKLVPRPWYLICMTPGRKAAGGALIGTLAMIFILFLLLGVAPLDNESLFLNQYQRWRLTKENASPRDRFRTNEYFLGALSKHKDDPQPKEDSKPKDNSTPEDEDPDPSLTIGGSIKELRYSGISPDVVKEFINLAAHSKRKWVVSYWLPQFAEGLQNPNLDTRARLHTAMLALVKDAVPEVQVPPLILDWKTSSDAQLGDLDLLSRAWEQWLPTIPPPAK
jgi:hypothetical protein